jgi:hypothetical protein
MRLINVFTGGALLVALAACGDGRDQEGPAERAAEAGVDSLGSAVGQAARNTGEAIETVADSAGAKTDRALDKTGNAIERGAENVERGAERAGERIERGAERTGEALSNAGDTVRKRTANTLRKGARAADPRD